MPYARQRTERPGAKRHARPMDILVAIVVGGRLGWIGFTHFRFNEQRGRNVSLAGERWGA